MKALSEMIAYSKAYIGPNKNYHTLLTLLERLFNIHNIGTSNVNCENMGQENKQNQTSTCD